MRKQSYASKETVLALSETSRLDKILSEVDAIDPPILQIVVFRHQLPLHGLHAILSGQLTLTEPRIYLGHIVQSHRVIVFKFNAIKAPVNKESKSLSGIQKLPLI